MTELRESTCMRVPRKQPWCYVLHPLPSDEQKPNQHPEQASFSNDIQDYVIKHAAPQDPMADYRLLLNITNSSLPPLFSPLPFRWTKIQSAS